MYKEIVLLENELSMYNDLKDNRKVFTRHFDTFLAASIIGCIKNVEYLGDEGNTNETRSRIEKTVLINNEVEFENVLNVVAFVHHSRGGTKKILEKVFMDSDEFKLEKQKIAIRYARGGIEILHNLITKDAGNELDIIENIKEIDELYDTLLEFNADFGSSDELLERLM